MTNKIENQKLHPFEAAGMGRGPYRFVGLVELPDLSENSARNFGNSNPYAEVQSYNLKAGAGTCACCGLAIRVICVVRDADGGNWGVGSDCVEKVGDKCVSDPARIAVAKRRNARAAQLREQRRLAAHAAWLLAPSRNNPAETNAERIDREGREQAAKLEARKAALEGRKAQFADVLHCLTGNDFYNSLASQLEHGPLSSRQAEYAAKAVLGRRVKANAEAFDALVERLTN
jgi:hypothetical protein